MSGSQVCRGGASDGAVGGALAPVVIMGEVAADREAGAESRLVFWVPRDGSRLTFDARLEPLVNGALRQPPPSFFRPAQTPLIVVWSGPESLKNSGGTKGRGSQS